MGHGREELARAAAEQMAKLAYYSNYVGSSNIPAVELATRLVKLAYRNLAAVFFTCGGAEANESAFKTARFYWKAKGKPDKVKIIARQNGYHGVTLQAMSATGMAPYWKMFEPRVPGFLHIQAPYPYRFQGAKAGESRPGGGPGAGGGDPARGRRHGRRLHRRAGHRGRRRDRAARRLLPALREICTRHEVLFIADEVITGFCRTGQWFALTHWGVEPDIMSFAKAVTSGYPARRDRGVPDIFDAMNTVAPENRWMHAYTYSGHPTCCAVGLANIAIMERERLWERAAAMGKRLHEGLLGLQKELAAIGDVRGGKGLLARSSWSPIAPRRPGSRPTRRSACGSGARWRSAGSSPASGRTPCRTVRCRSRSSWPRRWSSRSSRWTGAGSGPRRDPDGGAGVSGRRAARGLGGRGA